MRVFVIEILGDDHAQDGVAEELQSFVIRIKLVLERVTAVREGAIEQLDILQGQVASAYEPSELSFALWLKHN